MLWTCFSTVPSVTHRRRAIPALERPSAISASTSRSRGVSSSSGSSTRRAATSSLTSAGSTTEPPLTMRSSVSTKSSDVRDPALQQIPASLAAGEQIHRRARPRRGPRARGSRPAGSPARITCAASRPSVVCVGGIRMSTITSPARARARAAEARSRRRRLTDDVEARRSSRLASPSRRGRRRRRPRPESGASCHLGSIRPLGRLPVLRGDALPNRVPADHTVACEPAEP